jgi:hypothetical protein
VYTAETVSKRLFAVLIVIVPSPIGVNEYHTVLKIEESVAPGPKHPPGTTGSAGFVGGFRRVPSVFSSGVAPEICNWSVKPPDVIAVVGLTIVGDKIESLFKGSATTGIERAPANMFLPVEASSATARKLL